MISSGEIPLIRDIWRSSLFEALRNPLRESVSSAVRRLPSESYLWSDIVQVVTRDTSHMIRLARCQFAGPNAPVLGS